jgi:hypothetical protein
VRFCVVLTGEDVEFAREPWRAGVAKGVPAGLLINAYTRAFVLGLDTETGLLIPRIHRRADSDAIDI